MGALSEKKQVKSCGPSRRHMGCHGASASPCRIIRSCDYSGCALRITLTLLHLDSFILIPTPCNGSRLGLRAILGRSSKFLKYSYKFQSRVGHKSPIYSIAVVHVHVKSRQGTKTLYCCGTLDPHGYKPLCKLGRNLRRGPQRHRAT